MKHYAPSLLTRRQRNKTEIRIIPRLLQERPDTQPQRPLAQRIISLLQLPPVNRALRATQLPQMPIITLHKAYEMAVRIHAQRRRLRIAQLRSRGVRSLQRLGVVQQLAALLSLERHGRAAELVQRRAGRNVGARAAVADGVQQAHQAARLADRLLEPHDGVFAAAVVRLQRSELGVAGGVVGLAGADEDERKSRARNCFEEGGLVDAVDVVEAKLGGDAQGANEVRENDRVVF